MQGSSQEARRWLASEGETIIAADAKVDAELVALDWLILANESKNGGFYVDYQGEGHWSTPQAASEEQWKMADAVARPFVREAAHQAARNMEDLKKAGPYALRPEPQGDQ